MLALIHFTWRPTSKSLSNVWRLSQCSTTLVCNVWRLSQCSTTLVCNVWRLSQCSTTLVYNLATAQRLCSTTYPMFNDFALQLCSTTLPLESTTSVKNALLAVFCIKQRPLYAKTVKNTWNWYILNIEKYFVKSFYCSTTLLNNFSLW